MYVGGGGGYMGVGVWGIWVWDVCLKLCCK